MSASSIPHPLDIPDSAAGTQGTFQFRVDAAADATQGTKRPSQQSPAKKPAPKKTRRDPRQTKGSWNDNLFELLKFKAEHGHCDVPENHPLYFWVFTQRRNKRQAGKLGFRKLTEEHIKVLDCVSASSLVPLLTFFLFKLKNRILTLFFLQISFTWDPYKKAIDERWKLRFDELVVFKGVHGHCNVPQKHEQAALDSNQDAAL